MLMTKTSLPKCKRPGGWEQATGERASVEMPATFLSPNKETKEQKVSNLPTCQVLGADLRSVMILLCILGPTLAGRWQVTETTGLCMLFF